MTVRIIVGDCREKLLKLEDESVHCVVCSPPYWGLRDYGLPPSIWGGEASCEHDFGPMGKMHRGGGNGGGAATIGRDQSARDAVRDFFTGQTCTRCGAWRGCLGLEPTPQMYVEHLVEVFREVRRVLRADGTLWLNLGDSYHNGDKGGSAKDRIKAEDSMQRSNLGAPNRQPVAGLKPKDLVMVPARSALALQADGWWVRQDIIWCLSGGTVIYARTQKGDMPMTLKDLARLNSATVKLWNGKRWTQLLGMSKSRRRATELSLVLRSGERIACTTTHKFPTGRGLLEASQITVGDQLVRARLPEPDAPKHPTHISDDAAWFAGLYLAEGSMSEDTIQLAGHAKESSRWERVQRVAAAYGGSATRTVTGNGMDIRVYGRLLVGLVREFVSGKNAQSKHFGSVVWRYSNRFLTEYIHGYLDGDGHWEPKNERWRLGFCRNHALEQDLRTACARLGWTLTLNPGIAKFQGREMPAFRGELRMTRSGHRNERSRDEIVRIERGRCRFVYDLGVADEPHLFALASGVLTHNSKPNPMPESVRDRCTRAHEYLFLLSKNERYYFDAAAIAEPAATGDAQRTVVPDGWATGNGVKYDAVSHSRRKDKLPPKDQGRAEQGERIAARLGGGAGWREEGRPATRNKRSVWSIPTHSFPEAHFATFPPALIEPCILAGSPRGGVVLDPFGGAGTTGLVAARHGRDAILVELNPGYAAMAEKRIHGEAPLFSEVAA